MKELIKELKAGQFKSVYLFYGDEKYLLKHYERQLKSKLIPKDFEMLNLEEFEGKIDIPQVVFAANTLPFLSDYRLIIVRDSGLFGGKASGEISLNDLPESSVILFVEEKVDKRSKLYKTVSDLGRVVEFSTPSESELRDWIIKGFAGRSKQISPQTAMYLLRVVIGSSSGGIMDGLVLEADKVIAFTGQRREITNADIDAVCTKALELRVFELINSVARNQLSRGLEIYNNLILMKEQPMMILSLMARQFRLALQCKALQAQGMSSQAIASALSLRSFIVSDCLKQSGDYRHMAAMLRACIEADISIKTGKISDRLAVETLIVQSSMKMPEYL